STLNEHQWSAEELFWLYRNRWQIELLIKQMKQFVLLVRLRSSHTETVQTTVLAALVAWADTCSDDGVRRWAVPPCRKTRRRLQGRNALILLVRMQEPRFCTNRKRGLG